MTAVSQSQPPRIRIAGLDLSLTSTGLALPDGTLHTITSKHRGIPRVIDLRNQITYALGAQDYLDIAGVDLVVIEGYSFSSRNSQAHALGELGGAVRVALHEHDVPWVEISPATLKKYACGKGNAPKDQVLVAAVQRLGVTPANSDEADAAWLRAMALDRYGHPLTVMPKINRGALYVVDWPDLEVTADA